ncbi:protein of unknown function [endosymbiont DhMRE of Dentiscutata heterogama]|nr:protein of unknown function [endosymbiont DhMRE of Dentiscutata heterogama]
MAKAPGLGPGDREFKSRRSDHFDFIIINCIYSHMTVISQKKKKKNS